MITKATGKVAVRKYGYIETLNAFIDPAAAYTTSVKCMKIKLSILKLSFAYCQDIISRMKYQYHTC